MFHTTRKIELKQVQVECRVNWPQSKTWRWTDSAGSDCSCHCSARASALARTWQKLAVTLILAKEPCRFLFSPNVPHDQLKSPPCFLRVSLDRESYTVTPGSSWTSGSILSWCSSPLVCLETRDYLSVSAVFLVATWIICLLLIIFLYYRGMVDFVSASPHEGAFTVLEQKLKIEPQWRFTVRGKQLLRYIMLSYFVPYCVVQFPIQSICFDSMLRIFSRSVPVSRELVILISRKQLWLF